VLFYLLNGKLEGKEIYVLDLISPFQKESAQNSSNPFTVCDQAWTSSQTDSNQSISCHLHPLLTSFCLPKCQLAMLVTITKDVT
jgi:hypothetical protein